MKRYAFAHFVFASLLLQAMEEPIARTFLGTRGYLSPEQLSRRDYTKAVDSWALGVIVFGESSRFLTTVTCFS